MTSSLNVEKLSHSEEKIALEKQIEDVTLDFDGTNRYLEEKTLQNASFLMQAEKNKIDTAKLQDEIQKDENRELTQWVGERLNS